MRCVELEPLEKKILATLLAGSKAGFGLIAVFSPFAIATVKNLITPTTYSVYASAVFVCPSVCVSAGSPRSNSKAVQRWTMLIIGCK